MINRLLFILLILLPFSAFSQNRISEISRTLDSLSLFIPGLNESVEMSLKDSPIQELIRGLGLNHRLNISVDPSLDIRIVNNFSDAQVKDVFIFLCKEYDLDLETTGSIIAFKKMVPPVPTPTPYLPKKLGVSYNTETDFISLDLKGDSLDQVAKEITRQSMHNVILAPDLAGELVSVYIQNRPFDKALEKLAYGNGLIMMKGEDNFYMLQRNPETVEKPGVAAGNSQKNSRSDMSNKLADNYALEITQLENGNLRIDAQKVPIATLLEQVSHSLKKNYYLYNKIEGVVSLLVDNATYTEFLQYVLNGTNYTFKEQERVFMIGERNLEGLRTTELVKIENRPIENLLKKIPPELQKGLEIFEYEDLNSLILSGSYPKVAEVKSFLRKIDQVVPMVYIEVIITDYNKSMIRSGGVQVGLGDSPVETAISLSSGVDATLGAGTVNDILNSLTGLGVFNLGRVTPNFYASIQAMESNGMLKTRSTPKLSTVNGHEANLSVGRTEYYLEVQNNLIGTQNPIQQTTQNYKSVNADLSVKIKPMVSTDDQVTMDITVSQSDFTERINENAPPGSVSRSFSSRIRVRDGEMIVLGGLETQSTSKTGSGLPWISRVPVLNWFFGKQQKSKSEARLAIFIKPTIIY